MIPHPLIVASVFRPWQHAFWLALFHDSVEDGYLPRRLCRIWPALDAITRREGEVYLLDYIPRVRANITARKVKIADLRHNLTRCSDSLLPRYNRAMRYLEQPLVMEAA